MADRLVIDLVRWEPRPACYAYGGSTLPAHSAMLAPDVREAIRPLEDRIVLVTGYRSPEASAAGWREDHARLAGKRKGVARPGFSPHNFGLAVDLDVERTLRLRGWHGKADLDAELAAVGFRCWRDGARRGREWHHYTFGASAGGAKAMDAAILAYCPDLAWPNARWAQELLAAERYANGCPYYAGTIDGDWGPKSRAAMREWHDRVLGLDVDGRLNRFSWRALLAGTADVRIGAAP